jgi:hypothetical protein
MFGVWGCARGPAASSADHDKAKALETKVLKLDEDLKSALAAKELQRKKIGELEEAQAQLQQEVDRLNALAKTRTTERDQVQAKYETFLKDLKDLAGRAETALHGKPVDASVASRRVPAACNDQ